MYCILKKLVTRSSYWFSDRWSYSDQQAGRQAVLVCTLSNEDEHGWESEKKVAEGFGKR